MGSTTGEHTRECQLAHPPVAPHLLITQRLWQGANGRWGARSEYHGFRSSLTGQIGGGSGLFKFVSKKSSNLPLTPRWREPRCAPRRFLHFPVTPFLLGVPCTFHS